MRVLSIFPDSFSVTFDNLTFDEQSENISKNPFSICLTKMALKGLLLVENPRKSIAALITSPLNIVAKLFLIY